MTIISEYLTITVNRNPLEEMEYPSWSTKDSYVQYLDAISEMKKMNFVCFQGKPFYITVIQAFAPTWNAEEAEVEWLYEDLQDLLELI